MTIMTESGDCIERTLRGRRRFVFLSGSFLVATVAVVLVVLASHNDLPKAEPQLAFGIAASNWFNIDHALVPEELTGRPVLVEYWATWCGPCRESIPKLNGLQRGYADRGLVVVAITKEPSERVAGFVKRYDMQYVVGADQDPMRASKIKSFPHCVLYDSGGKQVWEGRIEGVKGALRTHVAILPEGDFTPVVQLGRNAQGTSSPTSDKCDESAIQFQVDAILNGASIVGPSDLNQLFRCYWESEDSEIRYLANTAVFQVWVTLREIGEPTTLDLIRQEMLRRLERRDSGWLNRVTVARYVGSFCATQDGDAIVLLNREIGDEKNPLVLYELRKSLGKIDANSPPMDEPPSSLERAIQQYGSEKSSVWSRAVGLSSELQPFERYRLELEQRLAAGVDIRFVRGLLRDYQLATGEPASDALIKDRILDLVPTLFADNDLSSDAKKELEMGVFEAFQLPEKDWRLRKAVALAMDAMPLIAISKEDLTQAIDRQLATEPVDSVRAHLEYIRRKVTGEAPEFLIP